jgi:DNA-binding transcriptional ArsR family regulator
VPHLDPQDPRLLRAIAHPTRNLILTELDARGPLRAADVAQLLNIPANQASFHLRQLAKFGLVEEDPDAARDKRDRVWRPTAAADTDISLSEVEKMPGGKAASAVFRRQRAAWGRQLVDTAYGDDRSPNRQISVAEQSLLLTKHEAEELSHRVVDTVREFKEALEGEDDDRRLYIVFQIVQPHPRVELDGTEVQP